MSEGSLTDFTKRVRCCTFVRGRFHYAAFCVISRGLSSAVISKLWSICNDNLIMLALSKYVCYPFAPCSPHYACIEGGRPSSDAHWCNACQDLGVAYMLRLKVNVLPALAAFSACFVFNETIQTHFLCIQIHFPHLRLFFLLLKYWKCCYWLLL